MSKTRREQKWLLLLNRLSDRSSNLLSSLSFRCRVSPFHVYWSKSFSCTPSSSRKRQDENLADDGVRMRGSRAIAGAPESVCFLLCVCPHVSCVCVCMRGRKMPFKRSFILHLALTPGPSITGREKSCNSRGWRREQAGALTARR